MLKSAMTSTKPVVLRLGKVAYAQDAWKELEKIATVIVDDSKDRADFLANLNGKYKDLGVKYITRTFASANVTGLFDQELIKNLPDSVISVSHCGAGYDQVDPHALTERGIQLSNVPNLVNDATADTHVFLLLGALRSFSEGQRRLLRGEWPSGGACAGTAVANDPTGKVVGILGMGGIGRNILSKLKPFGFEKFIYHNRKKLAPELEAGAEYVTFDELLAQSDILSVNIPLNKNTHHILNKEAFAKMKKGIVVVNTARGGVIDETAFIEALKDGTVRSAGLDVMENEPNVNLELASLPNVLALPHMGTNTYETIKSMEEFIVENVTKVIETGHVISLVPEQESVKFEKK